MTSGFEKDRIIAHWVDSSDSDFKTMTDLFVTRNNHWALFMGHLLIEKLLKALYVKNLNDYPPSIHDLRRLCEKVGVVLDSDRQILFDSISRFNINARYDDYKQSFYKLCTDSFTTEWIEKIIECRKWIKTML